MRIGMLLPGGYACHNPGDGRRVQAYKQADALERLGHEVVRMDAWHTVPRETIDVLHVFEGGLSNGVGITGREQVYRCTAVAPFIDSNTSFWAYNLVSRLHMGSRMMTPQFALRRQMANSDLVIARSVHERERFVRSLGAAPEKVAIVLNGVDPPPPPANLADGETVRKKLALPERFVLHVGMYTESRKNVLRLVEATETLKLPLVIAGTARPGATLDALRRRVQGSGGRVKLLDFVDLPTLQGLYAACEVFALPSTHEGTGLVALEAARVGAKLVITKNGGPPDYFGKWADYVDPASTTDIGRGLKSAWERPRSGELREHVSKLTWENSARQLVAAYESH